MNIIMFIIIYFVCSVSLLLVISYRLVDITIGIMCKYVYVKSLITLQCALLFVSFSCHRRITILIEFVSWFLCQILSPVINCNLHESPASLRVNTLN